MSLENLSIKKENKFVEQFPHLHHLTESQQEHFLILHAHNEKQEAADKKTEEQLLEQVYATAPADKENKAETQPHIGIDEELDHIHVQAEQEKVERTKRIVTNVVDFVPVVGSAKMILEGLRGKQYGTGKEIKGIGRFIHTVSGVLFFGLDITGVGAIASELGKGVIKVGERVAVSKIEQIAEKGLIEKAGEGASREILEKEVAELTARGKKRQSRQEKVANNA